MHGTLIDKIKEKKPLDRLDDSIVLAEILKFISFHEKDLKKADFENEKNSGFKIVLRGVRDELNKRYGVFWLGSLSLEGHKSSAERIDFYKEMYNKIFAITGNPDSILDISAGLNPLSLKSFKGKYICTELNQKDCDLLNKWFAENKINGTAIAVDLRKDFKFPKVNVVFLFKVFDSVEEKGHKLSEKILKELDCKYAVVSFSTATIRGRRMNFPYRGWIERLLDRLGLKYSKLEFFNEIFYVVRMNR